MDRLRRDRAKAFLRQYQRAKHTCMMLYQKIEELETAAQMPGAGYDGMPHGHEPRDLSAVVASIAEARAKAAEEAQGMVLAFKEVNAALELMPWGFEREILERRYILCQKWEVIAEEMHMSSRNVYRLHGFALEQVQVPEDWRRK